jgi:hypothetical protein
MAIARKPYSKSPCFELSYRAHRKSSLRKMLWRLYAAKFLCKLVVVGYYGESELKLFLCCAINS